MPVFVVETKIGPVEFTQGDVSNLLFKALLIPRRWWDVEVLTRPSEWTYGDPSKKYIEEIPVNADGSLTFTDKWSNFDSYYKLDMDRLQQGL